MAISNPNTITDVALTIPEVWSKQLYHIAQGQMYWNQFTGPELSGMPIIMKRELVTNPGDTIHIQQIGNIATSTGVEREATLRGSEQTFNFKTIALNPWLRRNGTSWNKLSKKRTINEWRAISAKGLGDWIANKMDADKWTIARSTGNVGFDAIPIEVIYGGTDITSVDALTESDDLTVADLSNAATILKTNDRPGVTVPGYPGKPYLAFIHPNQGRSLKQDSEWNNAQRYSAIRGSDNKIFTGAIGEIDGVVVYETTNCSLVTNANSPAISTARAVMVGAEAMAVGMEFDIFWDEDIWDYKFESGISVGASWETKVMTQKAIVQIVTAAVKQT